MSQSGRWPDGPTESQPSPPCPHTSCRVQPGRLRVQGLRLVAQSAGELRRALRALGELAEAERQVGGARPRTGPRLALLARRQVRGGQPPSSLQLLQRPEGGERLMARIRSIKPELRTSDLVASWPFEMRYFFVLLWGYLDDRGRGIDAPKRIAGDCFPHDEKITSGRIDDWL